MGVSENQGVPYSGVLIVRILLFRVPPIFGNSHVGVSLTSRLQGLGR